MRRSALTRRPVLTVGVLMSALLGTAAVVTTTVVTTAAPAQAAAVNETYPRPADGVYDLAGHGWGHGRGMSQHGARGAARLGKTADQITSTYYPGTAKKVIADTPIRVLISDDGRDTRVHAASGLRFRDVATGIGGTLPGGTSLWRVVNQNGLLRVQSLAGNAWVTRTFDGRSAFAGPVRFGGVGAVRVDLPDGTRDYRGDTYAVRAGSSNLQTVNHVLMESYLLGVVPRESPVYWEAAALQAQAIAARSHSVNKRDRVAGGGVSDICDTTACQVYGGVRVRSAAGTTTELEAPSTSSAVQATRNVIRTYGGKAIFAEYSSSNGGYSVAGGVPYLVARADPWDGSFSNTVNSWDARLPVADLERRFPAIGTLTQLRITARDGGGEWGGRVQTVVLTGSRGSVTTTGRELYLARTWPAVTDGLKHQWFQPRAEPAAQVAGSVTRISARVAVPRGGTGTTSFDVRNTGVQPWPVGGTVRTVSLEGGTPSRAPQWVAPARPGPVTTNLTRPGATEVRTGEVARLSFVLAGNDRSPRPSANEFFGVVFDGVSPTFVRAVVPYAIV